MVDLTGGFSQVGTGANKSVRGARVLLSTVNMDHSIADVYACRKDYFDENQSQIEQIAAGYFKASEEVIDLRKNETLPAKDRNEKFGARYKQACAMTAKVLNLIDDKKTPDIGAAHELIKGTALAALPGNYRFF